MDHELDQLGERIAEQAAHLDAAMHRLLTDLREFDARGGWRAQGAMSCAHWLNWRVGWDLVTARDHMRVARKLAGFPTIDDALRRGEVSYSKVRALLRVATPANETLLLDHARLMTASQLENLCRKYALVQRHGQDLHPQVDEQRRHVRRRDTEDGMVKIEAVLHPEEAEAVWAMLNHAAAQLAREASPATGSGSAESWGPVRSHVSSAASLLSPAPDSDPDAVTCLATELASELGTELVEPRHTRRPIDDSAESCEAAVPLLNLDTSELDDSAESHEEPRSHVALRASLNPVMSGSDLDAAACLASGAAQRNTSQSLDDSAESGDVASRAWLERLLEEADTFGGVEAAVPDPLDVSSDPVDAVCGPAGAGAGAEAGARARVEAQDRREVSELRERAGATRRAFNRADALVAVAQGYLRGDRPDRSPIEVVLTIPASTLRGASANADLDPIEVGEIGESFLSGETARRLSCDAGVVEVVEDEHGAPLSVGRKRRTIAGALKRALRKRDGACTYPGCTNRIFLEGHHIRHWADGGDTSLSNTTLLCTYHHRHVHEYGYAIEIGADQRPQFRDPHGRLVTAVPGAPAVLELGWPRIRAANEPLRIDATTIAGPWDGTPVDYGRIVGHLASADGLP